MTPLNHGLIRYNGGHAVVRAHMLRGRLGLTSPAIRFAAPKASEWRLRRISVTSLALATRFAALPGGLCQGHVAAGLHLLETGKYRSRFA